ncbi:MAG: hypothetical protein IID14_01935 [Candidatus Marinimicrobia bacterium]|nr:hypothetical protein [Candidatus Neomarinimicrobiota bacterium]
MKALILSLIILLATGIAPGQTPEKIVEKRDFPWESTLGIGHGSLQPTLSYRLANVPVFGAYTLPLHVSIGFLLDLGAASDTYEMSYALLEVRPLLAQGSTGFASMRALVGMGVGSYQLERPYGEYYPDGFDEMGFPITVATTGGTSSGMGYLLTTGLQLRVWRLEGEVRMNLRNGRDGPETFINVHAGFRAKTPIGAVAAHLIWLVPTLVLAYMLAGALGGGIGGF